MQDSQITWFSVEITAEPDVSEAIEFALNMLDADGTEIDSLGKIAGEDLVIVGYFKELPKLEGVHSRIREALNIYGFASESVKSIETKEVKNQDWLAEWKKHWKPTEIGNFIIAPSWTEIEAFGQIVIKIEPNMAFGTGTHETTKLCLKAIEKNYLSGMSFLDVGTGTGILSIAAGKINASEASKIVGCDTDVDSVKIARENAAINQTGGIKYYVGSINSETPQFDFVCANVTADVIIPMIPLLLEKCEKILVLSGILIDQEQEVLAELLSCGISKTAVETDGEWISILILKN